MTPPSTLGSIDAMQPRPEHPAPDESLLVARLQAGEERAFEILVREHGPRMLAVTRRILRDDAEAADALQEAFIAAFRSIGGFEGGARLSTWLHRVAVNAALMRIRSRARKAEQPIDDLLPSFLDDGHQASPATPWGEDAHALLERKEIRATVTRCIDQLPDSYRTVLILRDIEELDTEETATALGVNTNVVKIRLHRARQALRTLLDRHLRSSRT